MELYWQEAQDGDSGHPLSTRRSKLPRLSFNQSETAAVRIYKKHWKSSAKLLPRDLAAGERGNVGAGSCGTGESKLPISLCLLLWSTLSCKTDSESLCCDSKLKQEYIQPVARCPFQHFHKHKYINGILMFLCRGFFGETWRTRSSGSQFWKYYILFKHELVWVFFMSVSTCS